jgi:uncharacterized protein YciI
VVKGILGDFWQREAGLAQHLREQSAAGVTRQPRFDTKEYLMAEEVTMPWSQLADLCTANGLLGMRLYAVSSKPTNGLGPILANTTEHLEYQAKLEHEGVMFAAGPLANEDRTEWLGEGLFVYRAESLADARKIAEADPMHICGARVFTVREWMVNEGSYSVQVYFSPKTAPKIL